jgi:pilus assembly protein CpaB
VTNAKVLDVGKITALDPNENNKNQQQPTDAVPITFALSTLDAQRITYAESFAQRVRLAQVAPGSDTTVPDKDRTYQLAKDK